MWDIAFSNDAQQRYVFVADGHDKIVIVLQRDTLGEVGRLRQRRAPRRVSSSPSAASPPIRAATSTPGEQHHGKRIQKWMPDVDGHQSTTLHRRA